MKLPKNLAMILLAVWLILFGILTAPFLKFSFGYSSDLPPEPYSVRDQNGGLFFLSAPDRSSKLPFIEGGGP